MFASIVVLSNTITVYGISNWNGPTKEYDDYYYQEGIAYMYGYFNGDISGVTYEKKSGYFSDPRPYLIDDVVYNDWDIVGKRYVGTTNELGFTAISNNWVGDKFKNNDYKTYPGIDYMRKFKNVYTRYKTFPKHTNTKLNNSTYSVYKDGKYQYWIKPGSTVNIQIQGSQDFRGTAAQLKDYIVESELNIYQNGISNIVATYNKDGSFSTRNDGDGLSITKGAITGTGNTGGVSYNGVPQWKDVYSTFNVTATNDDRSYEVWTRYKSANGKYSYNHNNEYNRFYKTSVMLFTDGKKPILDSIEYPKVAVDNIDIRALGVRDVRGNNSDGVGVEKIEFRVFPKKDPSKAKVYLAIKNSDGSYSVGIDLKNDFPNIYGEYTIETIGTDLVGNTGVMDSVGTGSFTRGQPDLTITQFNVVDSNGKVVSNLIKGDEYILSVTVKNQGILNATSSNISLSTNNKVFANLSLESLQPNQESTKVYKFIPNLTGNYEVTAFADSNNEVVESNENNNKKITSYEVFYRNNKPKALFTVAPTLQDRNKTLIYTDKSTPGDEWDEIVQREWKWTRVEDENGKAVNEASKTGSTPPSSFSIYGKYKIELRVKDKGNIASPGLWSDWYTQYVTILESDLTIESITIIDKDGNDIGTNLVQNENYRAKIVVSNIGRKDSIPCVLELTNIVENKDKLIKELPIPSIQKNKSVTVFIPLNNIDTLGAKEIRGFIDSTNLVQEENENNNKYSKYITVYPKNNKPKAVFDVTPKVEDRNRLLTYSTEGTYDPDEWDEIVQWEWKWTRIKDEKGNAVNETVYTGAVPPSSFNTYGVYEIMLRVRDKGNVASPSLWSDWSEPKQVTIKNLITVNATISPNPSKQGQLVKIIMNTTYSPNKLIIDFPTDLVNVSKNNIKIDLNDDGIVDQKDLDLIKGFHNYRPSTPGWDSKYDLNEDGVIDIYDIVLIAANQGKEISTLDKLEPQVILDIPVMDDKVTTEYEFFLPLNTELTYDRKGKKLREPYVFTITALRELDGEREECKVELDVVGSIYDGIRTRMK